MAKKVVAVIKLALNAGKANPAPVGPALGQHGVNIMMFCRNITAERQTKLDGDGRNIGFRRPQFYVCSEDLPASVLARQLWKKGSNEPNKKAGWVDNTGTTARDCPNKAARSQRHDVGGSNEDCKGTARNRRGDRGLGN